MHTEHTDEERVPEQEPLENQEVAEEKQTDSAENLEVTTENAAEETEKPAEADDKPVVDETTKEEIKGKFFERIKQSFPGQEFASEEEMMQATMDHLNTLEIEAQETLVANEKVMEVLDLYPEAGDFLRDLAKGMEPSEAIARNFDVDALKPLEDDPDYDKYEAAKKDRKKRLKVAKEFELMLHQNRVTSAKNVEQFRTDNGLTEPEMNEFAGTLQKTLSEIMDGHYSMDFLNLMYKALNYEAAIAENRKQGEIRGKNIKIDELKKKGENKGDGLPHVTSQGVPETKKKGDPVAQSILKFQKNRSRFNV